MCMCIVCGIVRVRVCVCVSKLRWLPVGGHFVCVRHRLDQTNKDLFGFFSIQVDETN